MDDHEIKGQPLSKTLRDIRGGGSDGDDPGAKDTPAYSSKEEGELGR